MDHSWFRGVGLRATPGYDLASLQDAAMDHSWFRGVGLRATPGCDLAPLQGD